MAIEGATERSEKIVPDGLNQLWDAGDSAKLDIIFVHGLRGHPQATWEAFDADGDTVYWPKELLPSVIPESRIFSFGYPTEFATFYPLLKPTLIAHTNIDDNSISLLVKLGNRRRETNTANRPIVFVAHSLGGLVVANGLSIQSGASEPRQEVVNSTCGTIFLGTPFKGSDKASWAILAEKVLSIFGDSNDQTIKDLDKRSAKLQQISTDFHLLLQQRHDSKELNPIQVACFFETKTTVWKKKKDLGHVVTKQSATIAGYQGLPIHADHRAMCRFTDAQTTGYIDVTDTIKLMAENWDKQTASKERGNIVISLGNVAQGDGVVNYGIITGHTVGTVKDSVNLTVSHTFNSIGDGTSAAEAAVKALMERKAKNGL